MGFLFFLCVEKEQAVADVSASLSSHWEATKMESTKLQPKLDSKNARLSEGNQNSKLNGEGDTKKN